MTDQPEAKCPKCGADLSVLQTGPTGVHVPYAQWNRIQADLSAARQRIADLELSVSSDGLRMNVVDSLREKRQQLAAANARLFVRDSHIDALKQQLAERDAEIEGLREACRAAAQFYDELAVGPLEAACKYRDGYEPPTEADMLKIRGDLEAALASRRQGETST